MLKAMRATPKLTYPFEFRLFARAVFRLCRAVDKLVRRAAVPDRDTCSCGIRIILGTSNKLEYTQLLIEL